MRCGVVCELIEKATILEQSSECTPGRLEGMGQKERRIMSGGTTSLKPRKALAAIAVTVLILVILALYMGLWRGIWFDELLHFAMVGMTFEYAIKTVDYTTTEVNHGQTGIYLLLDWLILQVSGASAVALRLPSLIAAGFMLASAALFMRAKGFSWRWQLVVVMALGANSTLMFFTGEARPYMPMASSAVAMLAFYALPPEERRSWWGRAIGLFGFVFGAMIHPYWILMWLLIGGFSLLNHIAGNRGSGWIKGSWRFLAPAYVIPSIALYLGIGSLTWMRRVFEFGGDTNSIYDWRAITSHFMWDHFAFVPYYMPIRLSTGPIAVSEWVTITIAGLAVLTAVWVAIFHRCRSLALLPPLLLLGVGVVSSAVVTYQSYRLAYWIIERQWVAGMAISTVAIAWFFAEWWRKVSGSSRVLAVPAIAYMGLLIIAVAISFFTQVQVTIDRAQTWQEVERDSRSLEELVSNPGEQTYNYDPRVGYEYMANLNIARGGPVWEEFVAWYNKWAGMRPEFRDDNPGWSRFIWPDPSPQENLCIPQLCQGRTPS